MPARRLKLLAFLPLPLFLLALLAPKPDMLPEPPDRAEIFAGDVFVTPEGTRWRFVPFAERGDTTPLYVISVMARGESSVRWERWKGLPIGYARAGRWTYTLTSHRFDDAKLAGVVGDLRPGELTTLQGPLIESLNTRGGGRGTRLARLLNDGAESESMLCWQNYVLWAAWLSLPVAVAAGARLLWHRLPDQ